MLEALGVPTSRAFSLIETGEALQRGDEPSPTRSAVLTRLSHSHIRFGTFQRHAFFDRADLIAAADRPRGRDLLSRSWPAPNDRPRRALLARGGRRARRG